MFLKNNKQNDKNPILHAGYSNKTNFYGNPLILGSSLSQNNKLLNPRRNSHKISSQRDKVLPDYKQKHSVMNSIFTRRIQLQDKSHRNKTIGNCRKIINCNTSADILGETDINFLKLQAAKLDGDCMRFSERHPSNPQKKQQYQNQDFRLKTSQIKLRQYRKSNMRRIIKGRPQLSKIINSNKTNIFKHKQQLEYLEYLQSVKSQRSQTNTQNNHKNKLQRYNRNKKQNWRKVMSQNCQGQNGKIMKETIKIKISEINNFDILEKDQEIDNYPSNNIQFISNDLNGKHIKKKNRRTLIIDQLITQQQQDNYNLFTE